MATRVTSVKLVQSPRVQLLGVDLRDRTWFGTVRRALRPGVTTREPLSVPEREANRLVRRIIANVADIPRDSPPEVVWTQGSDELLVDTSSIRMSCHVGLVRARVRVDCDQIDKSQRVMVPLAVGTPERPQGLVMSTFKRVDGPAAVADVWSEALAAFAWEALVELARRLCAEVGKDSEGRPLIPVDIAAARDRLLILPMARHDISKRGLT